MELLHNPKVRSFIRTAHLKPAANWLKSRVNPSKSYEEKLSVAILDAIQPGDCVWDVGANVGFYTKRFADRVGPSGRVIAFEPFEGTFQRLTAATQDLTQVTCMNMALGAEDAELHVKPVAVGSTTNSLAGVSSSEDAEVIHVTWGDKLIRGGCPSPSILKIDVEGFEEDVLWGFRQFLSSETCRGVFIEVHFELLEKRGFLQAPFRLRTTLEDLGFETSWLDPSHLAGQRSGNKGANS
jgi:FkbM family methyltransferase